MSDSIESKLSFYTRIQSVLTHLRTHLAQMLFGAGFIVLLIELGGIWKEVHQVRLEQVKNQWYADTRGVRERVKKLPKDKAEQVKRTYESTSDVEVDGGTVSVDIDDQPIQVEMNQ
jgi:hypothetical protein